MNMENVEIQSFQSNSYSENSLNSHTYEEHYGAFVDLHKELKKLAIISVDIKRVLLLHEKKLVEMQKELDELKLENETLDLIYACSSNLIETSICERCKVLESENFVWKDKIAKFTYSSQNLDNLLATSRNVDSRLSERVRVLPGFYLEISLEREKARLGERWLTRGVENWEILKDSRLSEIWLAWARERGVGTRGSSLKRESLA
ncbi:hypothetical protein Lal_00033697 [Lupinus albus]|nr:hypothetical protein Lal_00033697 [Lupinus albus]